MSRMFSRWTASSLAAIMAMGVIAGCSTESASTPAPSATAEAKKETPTVKFMTAWDPGLPVSSDLPVFVEWGKRTGVKFEVNSPPRDSFGEKMNITIASNELPDMMKFFSDDRSFNNYGPDLFVPLDDYLKAGKLPNLQKWLTKYPEVEKRMKHPVDGKIYGFPLIQDFEFFTYLWYVRNDLLKKGGMDASQIKSIDDLKKAMLILKEQNGGAPITSSRLGYNYYSTTSQAYFGVADGIRYDPQKKKYVFSPLEDEKRYKQWVELERWMYAEKLLDPNFLTMKDTELTAGYASGKYPLSREQFTGAHLLNPKKDPKMEVVQIEPFKLDGFMPSVVRNPHYNIGYRSPVVINKKSKHIDDIIRAMDYTYSEEGIEFFMMGIEGETFTRDAKTPSKYRIDKLQSVWTRDSSGNYPAGMKKLQDYGYGTLWLTGVFPSYFRYNLLNYKEGQDKDAFFDLDVVKKMDQIGYLHDEPIISWTKEEDSKKSEISTPLVTYTSENVMKMILGQKPMSEWDSFIAGIRKLKGEEMAKIFNDKLATLK